MVKPRSKDNTAFNITALIAERNALLVSKTNPERLKKVQAQIDYFNYGLK